MGAFQHIVWGEGMFLHPHHFQQSERAISHELKQVISHNLPYCWGVIELVIKDELLKENVISVDRLKCVMPDIALVAYPERETKLSPLELDESTENSIVYLAIPIDNYLGKNVSSCEEEAITRYRSVEHNAIDNVSGTQEEKVQTKELQLSLVLGNEVPVGYTVLPIARVTAVTKDQGIILDTDFIPPCMSLSSSKRLVAYLTNVLAMNKVRAESIAQRLGVGKSASPSVMDFVMLQMLNRYEAKFKQTLAKSCIHPYQLYAELVEYIGELSTFTTKSKRCPDLAEYTHDQLSDLFEDLNQVITHQLSVVLEQTAIKLKLEARSMGINVAPLPNKQMLSKGQIVLAVKADCSAEELAKQIPTHVKIGPVEYIRDLVVSQTNGVQVKMMPMAPRQIPYDVGTVYFELVKSGSAWEGLTESSGIAIHISGDYTNLKSDLWCISK